MPRLARSVLQRAGLPAPAATPAAAASAPAESETAAVATRSQRNVGLPSPAGPRVTVGGTGAVAPEIIVAADARSIPQGSNVVGIEQAPSKNEATTSFLAGSSTVVGADPAQPMSAVTAVVQSWARSRSVTADDLHIRIDGDTAVARFHEIANGRKTAAVNRALTLKLQGDAWSVTDARVES